MWRQAAGSHEFLGILASLRYKRPEGTIRRFVEIRSYNLKPASRSAFHERMLDQAIPMLKRWKVDVVAFGPSPHDTDSYYLIRSYGSLDDRQQSQDTFYGSAEWRAGPREGLLALIDNYASIVLELEDSLVDALRQARVHVSE